MISIKQILSLLLFGVLLNSSETNQHDFFVDARDSNEYEIVHINELKWFRENLRFQQVSENDTLISNQNCGVFYLQENAKKACPKNWRLPTEKEVKALIKAEKKGKINLMDTLKIELCGRIDYEKHAKSGEQNTFWLNEDLEDGHVTHWHTFKNEHKIHSHNVVNARRKFPVRCVCEIQ